MPKITTSQYSEYSKYENESEVPLNVRMFIREIRKRLSNDLVFDQYLETKDLETGEVVSDLDFEIIVDTEKWVKNEYPNLKDYEKKYSALCSALGIDSMSIHIQFGNKEQFAEKFLKDFKKYLKSTELGGSIHSIRFDLLSKYEVEIKIILKRGWPFQRDEYEIKKIARDYLNSLGYSNIRIYIP